MADTTENVGTQEAVENTADVKSDAEETSAKEESTEKVETQADSEKKVESETSEKADEEKKPEKMFTQKELDDIVTKRLEREQKKFGEKSEKANAEINAMKNTIECYKQGIKEDCIEDAMALASRLVTDKMSFSDALKTIAEKYPNFCGKGTITTGTKFEEKSSAKSDDALRKAFGLATK